METVCKKLEEVERIGVWFRSDGCSDNRDRRSGLREASCDCYAARGNLEQVCETISGNRPQLVSSICEIEELEKSLDALAVGVSDTMGEDTPFRSEVSKLQSKAEVLCKQMLPLAEMYRSQTLEMKTRVVALEERHRAMLENESAEIGLESPKEN